MEALGLAWLGELGKQGLGYVLFCLSWVVVIALYRDMRSCERQSRTDAENMTKVAVLATKAIDDVTSVQRESVQAERETSTALQALGEQIKNLDATARERMAEIRREIRDRTGA